jgi:4-hydroxy-tetrahydrodipicolinate reductase
MGRLVADEILAAGAQLSGGTCLPVDIAPGGARLFDGIPALAASSDAVVDFTHAVTVQAHAAALAGAGCAWVLGTTGLTAPDQDAIHRAAQTIAVIQAANFSAGVNLVLTLAAELGAALSADEYDAEVLEMHHRQKVDAPSGTALAIGEAFAAGRGTTLAESRTALRDGHTGARPPRGIGFASLRGGQIVGEHSLILTAADEQIVLTHKAFDRRSFARGAVRAALWSAGRAAGLYGMRDVISAG